jgi:hypothetical protein
LRHVKEPYRARVRCFVGQISRTLFLTRDSPASLTDGSVCWIRLIHTRVLELQASHLLLIRTNLGYGTVLTAACAYRGCGANGLVFKPLSESIKLRIVESDLKSTLLLCLA